jgi:glycerophosphoryl diester phosphodiesterase family protein
MSDTGFTPPPPPPPPPSGGGGGPLPSRGLGDILSTAFEVYKANAAKLAVIVAIVVIPLALLSSLFTNVFLDPTARMVNVNGIPTLEGAGFFTVAVAGSIGVVIAFIMAFVLQAALSRASAQAVIGDPVDPEASYRYGFRRFGSVLLVSFLAGLIILVGIILLVIPGLIFAVFLAVAIPALVIENKRGTDALGRSWNLVKGSFWHVLGTVIVAGLIGGIVSSVIGAIGGDNWFLSWIFTSIGQIVVAPFNALVLVILYLDLRARQESLTADTLRREIAAGG